MFIPWGIMLAYLTRIFEKIMCLSYLSCQKKAVASNVQGVMRMWATLRRSVCNIDKLA